MRLLKKDIVDKVYNKLNGTVSRLIINDVINITYDYICSELEKNRVFSVINFGTFSIFKFQEHDGLDISSGLVHKVSSFHSVKFHPHAIFRMLLSRKRKEFEKPE
jgi:nucleoid DNA-binding protein